VLASNILITLGVESHKLRDRKRTLQAQLNPVQTYSTASEGRIELLEQPLSPRLSRFVAGGLVIGLLMGLLLSLWRSRESIDKKH